MRWIVFDLSFYCLFFVKEFFPVHIDLGNHVSDIALSGKAFHVKEVFIQADPRKRIHFLNHRFFGMKHSCKDVQPDAG